MSMRRFIRKIANILTSGQPRPARRTKRRLELEPLENRCVPANASGVVTGTAFLDANDNGARDAGESVLPGILLSLRGTTAQGLTVDTGALTDANGAYTILNVLPGTYQLGVSAPGDELVATGFAFGNGSPTLNVTVGEGQTVNQDVAVQGGLAPAGISMRQFLTTTSSTDFAVGTPGAGSGLANFRANDRPVLETPIADVSVGKNSADTVIDLAGNFDDVDFTNSQIRFDTSMGAINVELFDKQAPRTVANFFNYVLSNRFDNSIFNRLVSGFVLQGGGFTFQENPSALVPVNVDPTVQNEFGTSNTQGTIAMAKQPTNPNSATSQYFFNLANNSGTLDNQNGGFTVFGKLVGAADQQVLSALAALTTQNHSPGDPNGPFATIPLINYTGSNFPTDTTAANYALIQNVGVVRRDEFLTYAVIANTNPGLVDATITDNRLRLDYAANAVGTAQITIRATDRFGASTDATFNVTIANRAPTASVAFTPIPTGTNDTLTATVTASDPDGDPVTLTYVWKVNGSIVKTTTATSSLTDTLDLSAAGNGDTGDTIIVEVTPNDGTIDGSLATATTIVV